MHARNILLTPKRIGIAALLVALFIAMFNELSVTSFSIADNNPASYVIVVMLMMFLLVLFSMKEDLAPGFSKRNSAIAAGVLVLYVLAFSFLKVYFSFEFQTFRLDALLFPIALTSIIIALFGPAGLRKLKVLLIYSIFASPILLLPILNLSQPFTMLNAQAVFGILKLLGVNVFRNGIVISSASGSAISIASTCADIGAFVALLMFLIPVAYVYNGRLSRKALWLLSGMLLIFVLNILRMLSIALVWAYYGLGPAVNAVHLFIGQILFDITIVVMILATGKYSLYIRQNAPKRAIHAGKRRINALHSNVHPGVGLLSAGLAKAIAAAILIGLIVLVFTMPLQSYAFVSPFYFYNQSSNVPKTELLALYVPLAGSARMNAKSVYVSGSEEIFGLYQSKALNATAHEFMLINATDGISLMHPTPRNVSILGSSVYTSASGTSVYGYLVKGANATFNVDYMSMPLYAYGSYVTANVEILELVEGNATSSCGPKNPINSFYSGIYEAISGNYGNKGMICSAIYVANSQ
ncbi:exosortase/archaeosortase family protein [Candidatus Marsarchaeota archaeon]|nr:exosortase/archaeosortase family protein [Candidatus Marsarchaeota archaeon]MCL5405095.1 exosortase/archaeosortase family protein [Candidatus Marsarchaeota archaeon]